MPGLIEINYLHRDDWVLRGIKWRYFIGGESCGVRCLSEDVQIIINSVD